jgi:hypothetical protein
LIVFPSVFFFGGDAIFHTLFNTRQGGLTIKAATVVKLQP